MMHFLNKARTDNMITYNAFDYLLDLTSTDLAANNYAAATPHSLNATSAIAATAALPNLDDLIVLQNASSAYVGGDAGNDTYLLSGSMLSAGLNLTISDNKGSNSLQLVNGLAIASSKVANNALQLTLNNGSVINVFGANTFTYETGGNMTTGVDLADVSYASFAQNVLGVVVPGSGVAGGAAVIVGNQSPVTALLVQSKLDDFVVLQKSSSAYVGAGAGNDTYLLSSSMLSAGLNLTISDSQGANSLQLANGLNIASSKVASNALQLTLTNGSVINVFGADAFTYDIGGNKTVGIDNIDINYASFVQSVLGVTLPTSGVVSGGAAEIGTGPLPPILTTPLVPGTTASVVATTQADIFSFTPAAAKALVANTQINLNQFDTVNDKLQFDLTTALGTTTLAALDGVEGISVQANDITNETLITFGADANGDVVSLMLVGVVTPASVVVNVV